MQVNPLKVLVTGAKGFLGKFIVEAIVGEVISLGRGNLNDLVYDLSKEIPLLPSVDLVVHNAGKAHVIPKNNIEEHSFYKVNVQGTRNLLKALDLCESLPKSFVFISTVAVYGQDKGFLIKEDTNLEGTTPYAKSKIEAENLINKWCKEKGVNLVILRLPLVIGLPDPPGNFGAMLRGIKSGRYARIGNGQSSKSMVLATDIAALIPTLLNQNGIYNLTDRVHPTLAELEEVIGESFGKKILQLPMVVLKATAKFGDFLPFIPINSYRLSKLTASLTYDDQLAVEKIGWTPNPVLDYLEKNLKK